MLILIKKLAQSLLVESFYI